MQPFFKIKIMSSTISTIPTRLFEVLLKKYLSSRWIKRLFFCWIFILFMIPGISSTPLDHHTNQPIRVLIVTGMDHPAHNWRETTEALKEELAKDKRMRVHVLEDPYRLDSIDLTQYDVVFLHFNNWEKPDPSSRAEANLQQFVARGGGLVLMHFACGAFRNWTEFPKLAGRVWDRKNAHDPRGSFRVVVADSVNPITHGMESYETDDELYICLTGTQPITLLAKARSKVTGKYHPMAFVLNYGKGRVFQTTLGHDAVAIHIPGTAQLIRRGVAWTARRSVSKL